MIKKIRKYSKWFHKYFGLILILFLMWESLSGIFMNHPELIDNISVPKWLVPSQYHIENWNRSSLIKVLYSNQNEDDLYLCGKQGVWKSNDGGMTFSPFMKGLPTSPYYFKTNDIYLLNSDSTEYLYAAANGGLFLNELNNSTWQRINLNDENEKVKKVLRIEEKIIAVTESNIYEAKIEKSLSEFKIKQIKYTEAVNQITLVDLFFHLHDGRIWGLPGKLLFDFTGLMIFFLSISAFYTWYFPKMLRRRRKNRKSLRKSEKNIYKFLFKYHLKLGMWLSVIMIIISFTGFFMRPPMLAAIATGTIDPSVYPGFIDSNPLHEKIHNAFYSSLEQKIILQTKLGEFSIDKDFVSEMKNENLGVPIFVMGATVFEQNNKGDFLIGSFNGLFLKDKTNKKLYSVLDDKDINDVSNVRPADTMVTGYFKTPAGEEFITAHAQGLLPIDNQNLNGRFYMPTEIKENYRMPLWNYFFEIHNGRFFKGILGGLYILLVPFGSLIFFILLVTGIYDWLIVKRYL